jgi:hypothetical protein
MLRDTATTAAIAVFFPLLCMAEEQVERAEGRQASCVQVARLSTAKTLSKKRISTASSRGANYLYEKGAH